MVKSYDPGEQIVHAKVRDKGIDGNGRSVHDLRRRSAVVRRRTSSPSTIPPLDAKTTKPSAWNPVGTEHDLHPARLRAQARAGSVHRRPAASRPRTSTPTTWARSYDGVIDWIDAAYFGGIFLGERRTTRTAFS